jgi:acetyltransferase-like isoleucine patch superfamily enzyme
VTDDVPDYAIVAGVPARIVGDVRLRGDSNVEPKPENAVASEAQEMS